MKKRLKIITAGFAAGVAVTFAGCGGCMGCAGCSGCGGETNVSALTRSNWFTGTSYNGIQPSFIKDNDKFSPEKIKYDVTYDKENANNANISLDYQKGSFTTEFYATRYDWNNSGIPEGYAPEDAGEEIVYYYKTELKISVQFTMKTGSLQSSDWFNDSVVTEAYFRAAGNLLKPVYSKQIVKSHSPKSYQPVNLEQAIIEVDETYENFYSYDCTKVKSFKTADGTTEEKEYGGLNKVNKTLFDNSSLYIAVRSMKLSSNFSQPIALFSPMAGGIDEYAVTGSDSGLTAEEKSAFTAKLKEKELFAGGEEDLVEASAANISFAGGDLHGTSQTVWYASVKDSDNNIPRATMLKLSVPISYSLGTLDYTLNSIESTLWNGK